MNRPFISLPQFIIEIISFVVLALSFIIGFVFAATTEGLVPTHFTISGEVNGYGSPWVLLLLPSIMLVCFFAIVISLHVIKPSSWNFSFKISEGREMIVYHYMTWSYVLAELGMAVFSLITIFMWKSGTDSLLVEMIWLPLLFAGAIIPCILARKNAK